MDLLTQANDYESEYLSVSGTLTSAFATSGTGHMQASLSTVGNPNTPGTFTQLKLRMPMPLLTTLQGRYDLTQGCSVTTTGPLWRFAPAVLPSAWEEKDLQVLSCPAPRLLSVVPTSATSLSVRFDRRLRPESLLADGSQQGVHRLREARRAAPQRGGPPPEHVHRHRHRPAGRRGVVCH